MAWIYLMVLSCSTILLPRCVVSLFPGCELVCETTTSSQHTRTSIKTLESSTFSPISVSPLVQSYHHGHKQHADHTTNSPRRTSKPHYQKARLRRISSLEPNKPLLPQYRGSHKQALLRALERKHVQDYCSPTA